MASPSPTAMRRRSRIGLRKCWATWGAPVYASRAPRITLPAVVLALLLSTTLPFFSAIWSEAGFSGLDHTGWSASPRPVPCRDLSVHPAKALLCAAPPCGAYGSALYPTRHRSRDRGLSPLG